MRIIISNFCKLGLLAAALTIPVSTTTAVAWAADGQGKTYHDERNNQDHEWNAHEDKAYRMWVKENHRKYKDFSKLREEDRQSYWQWRHEHSDALLHIDIR